MTIELSDDSGATPVCVMSKYGDQDVTSDSMSLYEDEFSCGGDCDDVAEYGANVFEHDLHNEEIILQFNQELILVPTKN